MPPEHKYQSYLVMDYAGWLDKSTTRQHIYVEVVDVDEAAQTCTISLTPDRVKQLRNIPVAELFPTLLTVDRWQNMRKDALRTARDAIEKAMEAGPRGRASRKDLRDALAKFDGASITDINPQDKESQTIEVGARALHRGA